MVGVCRLIAGFLFEWEWWCPFLLDIILTTVATPIYLEQRAIVFNPALHALSLTNMPTFLHARLFPAPQCLTPLSLPRMILSASSSQLQVRWFKPCAIRSYSQVFIVQTTRRQCSLSTPDSLHFQPTGPLPSFFPLFLVSLSIYIQRSTSRHWLCPPTSPHPSPTSSRAHVTF